VIWEKVHPPIFSARSRERLLKQHSSGVGKIMQQPRGVVQEKCVIILHDGLRIKTRQKTTAGHAHLCMRTQPASPSLHTRLSKLQATEAALAAPWRGRNSHRRSEFINFHATLHFYRHSLACIYTHPSHSGKVGRACARLLVDGMGWVLSIQVCWREMQNKCSAARIYGI